jgi:DNA-binding IclR family transcriptional regulator
VLTTRLAQDLVRRAGSRSGYRFGPKIMAWGAAFLREVDLLDEFRNVAGPIVRRINETMQLAVMDWSDAVFVAHIDSRRRVRLVAEVGRRVPAHASAVGKALLAFSSPEFLECYRSRPFERLTTHTVVSFDELAEQLAAVRRRGWAEAFQETDESLCCLRRPSAATTGRSWRP